jgi:hypothetical protein
MYKDLEIAVQVLVCKYGRSLGSYQRIDTKGYCLPKERRTRLLAKESETI